MLKRKITVTPAMKIVQGDLIALALDGHFDVIIHGCNCDHSMAAGIARSIRQSFPEAYAADLSTTAGDLSKLGTYSMAVCDRGASRVTVVNAYTQAHPSGGGVLADYDAIRKVMRALKRDFPGQRIGYPKIGAGLARGDWATISRIISEELRGEDHTLVEFTPAT